MQGNYRTKWPVKSRKEYGRGWDGCSHNNRRGRESYWGGCVSERVAGLLKDIVNTKELTLEQAEPSVT